MDFYSTTAQVIPVLLLALVWDSGYAHELRARTENEDNNVKVWKKGRIRIWSIAACSAAVLAEIDVLLVLAEVVPAGLVARIIALLGIAGLIGSLMVRLYGEIIRSTKFPENT